MPKVVTPLTIARIRAATPDTKDFSLFDGGGLYLLIRTGGAKVWRLKFAKPNGKPGLRSLGNWPDVSLEDARRIREQARAGVPPIGARGQRQSGPSDGETLLEVFDEWFASWSRQVKPKVAIRGYSRMETYVLKFENLGQTPIADIRPRQLVQALRKLEADGKLTVLHAVLGNLRHVFGLALATERVETNIALGLAALFPSHKPESFRAFAPDQLDQLLHAVERSNIPPEGYALLYWQLLTLARPGEAVATRLEHINFEKRLWVIPANRMKKNREHDVPLSDMAIALLRAIWPENQTEGFLFPALIKSRRAVTGHIQVGYVLRWLKIMGLAGQTTSHGFRSLASTTLNESGLWRPDVIEMALAHVQSDRVRAAYNRARYMPERVAMLQWWADHIRRHLAQVPNPTGRIPAFLADRAPLSTRTDRR
ncbi:tyrosine-type recombinase/integrase [Silvimonas soli]|uniref:tyrosine-type recombinase/integrase n=1 Tax=Silvimonas soli TaxID=2980100 RepID=UPI0024B397E4|nr:tyrosine-type recombinase/integrase [Silvimonas soli]